MGTEIPFGEPSGSDTRNRVIWRKTEAGRQLARSRLLPAVNTSTMIQPGYAGRMYYMAEEGKLIELTVRPSSGEEQLK